MLLIFNLAKQSSNLSLSGWATKKEEGPGGRLGERRGGGGWGGAEGAKDSTLNWNHRKFLIY